MLTTMELRSRAAALWKWAKDGRSITKEELALLQAAYYAGVTGRKKYAFRVE